VTVSKPAEHEPRLGLPCSPFYSLGLPWFSARPPRVSDTLRIHDDTWISCPDCRDNPWEGALEVWREPHWAFCRGAVKLLDNELAEAISLVTARGITTGDLNAAREAAANSFDISLRAAPMPPPVALTEWVTLDARHQVARSTKSYNVVIDPMNALRNGIAAAKEAGVAAGAAGFFGKAVALGALGTAQILAAPLACLAFILAAHFGRRRDLTYEHGCVLAFAWSVAEYVDGKFVFVEEDLIAAIVDMPTFGVHDFNEAKARTALSRLEAWGMMKSDGPAYILLERITVKT
jgi:hypothetical protein